MNCAACTSPQPPGTLACGKCGAWNLAGGGPSREAKLVPLSEVKASQIERVRIGGGWDRAIGDGAGLPLQTEIVITGAPGSGKSTCLQHTMDSYLRAAPNRWGYYLSFEQSGPAVRLAFEQVLGRVPERLLVPNAMEGGANLSAEDLKKYPPIFVVVDSVSRACGKDLNAAVAMGQYFKTKIAVPYNCIVALVFHMNKSEDISGRLAAVHDADVLLAMEEWSRGDPVQFQHPDYRVLSAYKNRCGPAHVQAWFRMSGKDGRPYHGLEEVAPEQETKVTTAKGLAGATLELQKLEDEFKSVTAEYREQITAARRRALKLATDDPTAALVDAPEDDVEPPEPEPPPPPRMKRAAKPAPDVIEVGGQRLVKKPRGAKTLRLVTPENESMEGPDT